MARYIDADRLMTKIHELYVQPNIELWQVVKCVCNSPTADVVPKSKVEELIKSVDDMLDLACAMTGLELTYFGKYAELRKKYIKKGEDHTE